MIIIIIIIATYSRLLRRIAHGPRKKERSSKSDGVGAILIRLFFWPSGAISNTHRYNTPPSYIRKKYSPTMVWLRYENDLDANSPRRPFFPPTQPKEKWSLQTRCDTDTSFFHNSWMAKIYTSVAKAGSIYWLVRKSSLSTNRLVTYQSDQLPSFTMSVTSWYLQLWRKKKESEHLTSSIEPSVDADFYRISLREKGLLEASCIEEFVTAGWKRKASISSFYPRLPLEGEKKRETDFMGWNQESLAL